MISGLYGKGMFSFVKSEHAVFQSRRTILYFHQQSSRIPVAWQSSSAFGIVSVLDFSILMAMQWYLTAIFIFNSLMTKDVEYLMLIFHLYIFFDEMSVQRVSDF